MKASDVRLMIPPSGVPGYALARATACRRMGRPAASPWSKFAFSRRWCPDGSIKKLSRRPGRKLHRGRRRGRTCRGHHLAVRGLRVRRAPARAPGPGRRGRRRGKTARDSSSTAVARRGSGHEDRVARLVWPRVAVVDGSLATAISKIRKLLGDDGSVIRTVPRVGYKLGVPVHCTPACVPSWPGLHFEPGLRIPGRGISGSSSGASTSPRQGKCGWRSTPRHARLACSSRPGRGTPAEPETRSHRGPAFTRGAG